MGILVVCYGAREAALIDAFTRSLTYHTKLFVVDRQRNPFNLKRAVEHIVIPTLDVKEICRFASKRQNRIDFGIVGPEKPIISGIRDLIEKETEIPVVCPTKRYAIEASKVNQRCLFQETVPNVNPRFKVFDPHDSGSPAAVKKDVYAWLEALENRAVVKPDSPAAGKGVGVWGDHFTTREALFEHFLANYEQGRVVIEEKIEGEESSFQALCDGRHLVTLPEVRDYKRAFDGDEGPNTGGMGSYKDSNNTLPFMTAADREKETEIVNRIFNHLKRRGDGEELRGIPFYAAFIHSRDGPKILENNSRPGDPEIINILPLLKDDFVDVCFKIIEGNLTKVELEKKASVVTYKVPPTYGGYDVRFPDRVRTEEVDTPLNLEQAHSEVRKLDDSMRLYPASVELRDSCIYPLSSRAVAAVGFADTIADARRLSLRVLAAIEGGALWHRNDIAARENIQKSVEHMNTLRQRTQ